MLGDPTRLLAGTDCGFDTSAGNGRVVRARLSDALYFWRTDQADLPDYVSDANRGKPLDQRMAKLRALDIVFHEKLGTQAQRVERIASKTWRDDRLVFATPTGGVLDPKKARTELAEICRRAGVPVTRPNELRHSCASLLADEGIPNETIADLLGHTTTRMVDTTYRHRLRPVVDVAARATWAAQ